MHKRVTGGSGVQDGQQKPVVVAQIIGRLSAGGVEAVVNNYWREMDEAQVRFDYYIDDDSPCEPSRELLARGVRYVKIPSSKHPLRRAHALQKLFRENRYPIVHAHMNSLNQMVLYAAWRAGVPVRISHSHSTSDPAEGMRAKLKETLRHTGGWFATDAMACGEAAGRWLFGEAAMEAGEVTILPNAIDLNRFAFDEQARGELRAQLGVEGRFVVGHVGRFMKQKNHSFLIRAFSTLHADNPNAVLLLVGDGALKASVEQQARSLGLADAVRFLGMRDDVAKLYSAFDVFVLPSLYEGLPVVGLEAQAAGLPCLLSDHVSREAGVRQDVRFLPLDVATWAREMEKCGATDGESRRMAMQQMQGGPYDLHACGKKLQAYYQERLARAR